jgi:uncharacterized damage-inducible protein DinB
MTTAKDVIRNSIEMSDFVILKYVEDLTDDELLAAAGEGMNPIAWQLGHILTAERSWVEGLKPGSCPPLPEGFEAAHSKETAAPNKFRRFASRDDYVKAWKAQREATLAVLDGLPDEQLGAETGVGFAPTVAALLNMVGVHALMHAGQFVPVRRRAGKPVVI